MLLTRESILKVDDKYIKGDVVYIHFPIIYDVVECIIKDVAVNKVLLTLPENSDLYNYPDFWFKKSSIIGKIKKS